MTPKQFLDALFTNYHGEIADRLVLMSKDGRDLGGLGRAAVAGRLLAVMPSRFFVGQRVRFSEQGMTQFGDTTRFRIGTVVRIRETGFGRYLAVKRDGLKSLSKYHESNWEPIPLPELQPDAICEQLVAAYMAGELDAANALADRLFELRGGT